MRYSYNEVGGLINGVMFFFEKGDTEIAVRTFKAINASEQLPTSIVWNGDCPAPSEVLRRLRERNALDNGFLGVRFTVDESRFESRLLREYLEFLGENYPALSSLTDEINSQVFGTPN